jgi:hypothetical protein
MSNGASTAVVSQSAFNAGEVDEILWRRTDLPGYLRGAKLLENMETTYTASIRKRRGRLFCMLTENAETLSQLYPFQDKYGQYYIILAYNEAMDIINLSNFTVVATIVTPYESADIVNLDYDYNNDVITFTHADYPPARIYVTAYSPAPAFAYQVLDIYPQPAFDFNNINYNQFTVVLGVVGNVLTFQFTGLGADPGFTSAWVGGLIIGGGTTIEEPLGYAIITNVLYSSGTTTFTATVYVPFQTTGYITLGNGYSIRQPVFTAALGYPAVVSYYQNRLFFGNTQSLKDVVFGSRVNAFTNFDTGTGSDVDALIYTIGKSDTGGIVAINPGKQLEIYTQNYEFVCPQEQSVGLTPATFSIRQQSSTGSNGVMKPISYLNDTYYASKAGSSIINFHFNGVGLSYTSTNVSIASQHLVKNPINRALQRSTASSQNSYIYFLNEDRSLTSFQFTTEFKDGAVPVGALTPVVSPDGIVTIDIIGINDQVYFLNFYENTATYQLEVFTDQVFSNTNQLFLDNMMQKNIDSTGLITGLTDYNGYTFSITYNGQDFGNFEVIDGDIQVTDDRLFSQTAYIGLPYSVNIELMDYFAGPDMTDALKLVTRLYVDYYSAIDFQVNGIRVPYQTYEDIQNNVPITPQTGTWAQGVEGGWQRDNNAVITQNSPFDIQISAVRYQIAAALI